MAVATETKAPTAQVREVPEEVVAVVMEMVALPRPIPEVVVEVACTAVKHQVVGGQMAL